jgi:hypothetical protein
MCDHDAFRHSLKRIESWQSRSVSSHQSYCCSRWTNYKSDLIFHVHFLRNLLLNVKFAFSKSLQKFAQGNCEVVDCFSINQNHILNVAQCLASCNCSFCCKMWHENELWLW